jgi:hypothetical protein
VNGFVAFRYAATVTVAGKGGRPKKWRSDADRVKAYRARQRGDEEPTTLASAADSGDALAGHVLVMERLQAELAEARRGERHVRTELEALQKRNDWLEGTLAMVTSTRDRLIDERNDLVDQLAELQIGRNDTSHHTSGRSTAAERAVSLSRAERRRLDRDRRRRGQA